MLNLKTTRNLQCTYPPNGYFANVIFIRYRHYISHLADECWLTPLGKHGFEPFNFLSRDLLDIGRGPVGNSNKECLPQLMYCSSA
jgi:hypothetical protein